MQISSISVSKATFNANSNHSQKKVGFSGIYQFALPPTFHDIEAARFIEREIKSPITHHIVMKIAHSIQDGAGIAKEFFIALTGKHADRFIELLKTDSKHPHPLETVVTEAGKSHLLA